MISAIGSVVPRLGCVVTEPSSQSAPGGRLLVIDGRAYRRVELPGHPIRQWRLERLELPEAIDWLIREQQEPPVMKDC